jgi:hypothetical protein
MNTLVLGANGKTGRRVADRLEARGVPVLAGEAQRVGRRRGRAGTRPPGEGLRGVRQGQRGGVGGGSAGQVGTEAALAPPHHEGVVGAEQRPGDGRERTKQRFGDDDPL